METFTGAREFAESHDYTRTRQATVTELDLSDIDGPITDVVEGFNALPHCFTLQCCCGHFLCLPEQELHNVDPVPPGFTGLATYRIAYVALCLENSRRGQALRRSLARLEQLCPDFIQFGSADWFWERWKNSYVLQVGPRAHMLRDEAILGSADALRTQAARDLLFAEIRVLLAAELRDNEAG